MKAKPFTQAPNGQRECTNCMLCHPERPKRPCSAFGQLENKNKDCSLYIEKQKEE